MDRLGHSSVICRPSQSGVLNPMHLPSSAAFGGGHQRIPGDQDIQVQEWSRDPKPWGAVFSPVLVPETKLPSCLPDLQEISRHSPHQVTSLHQNLWLLYAGYITSKLLTAYFLNFPPKWDPCPAYPTLLSTVPQYQPPLGLNQWLCPRCLLLTPRL